MELPKYLYPKYYSVILSDGNQKEEKDIKLYKNLKLEKQFLEVRSYYQQNHENNYNYEKKIKEETNISNKKLQNILNSRDALFNSIQYFKEVKFASKKYNTGIGFTNAWKKMYEVCQKSNFIPSKLNTIKHLDICGLPGGFVLAINHYLKTKTNVKEYDWYLQSYLEKGHLQDDFGLVKKYPKRFLEGDITSRKKIEHYIKFFNKNKRNIVTSDCGLGGAEAYNSPDFDFRDKQMMKIFLGQFVCGLGVLEKGGNFFMKSYNSFNKFTVSLIYLMSSFFQKVTLLKPMLSKQPDGKEIYYCLYNFTGITDDQLSKLLNILENYNSEDLDRNIVSYNKMDKNLVSQIEEKLAIYYYQKLEVSYKVEEYRQDVMGFDISDDPEEYLNTIQEIKKSVLPSYKRFVSQYYKKLKYERIKDSDRLL